MISSKVAKLFMNTHSSFLGMKKGCFVLKDRYENFERYPSFDKGDW